MTIPAKHIVTVLLVFANQMICYADNEAKEIRKSIVKIARQIAKYETVDRGAVGFSAERTEQYDRFDYLMKNATEDELLLLTNHKNPNVRAYSFEILVIKGYKNIRPIINKHITDVAVIRLREGCMSSTQHVNLYFLRLVTPRINDRNAVVRLTDSEVKEIKAQMMEAIVVK